MTTAEEIVKETSERYNDKLYYKLTKLNYIVDVKQYLKQRDQRYPLRSREWVTNKITELKNIKADQKCATKEYYDVALQNEKEILIVAGTVREVIPYEDYFNLFIDLHLRFDHMPLSSMIASLSTNYDIDQKFIEVFINCCNICHKKDAKDLIFFNELIHIDILGMLHKPNNGFKYILIYVEQATNYVILRPLLEVDTNEVSAELLKIFIDFGTPLAISTTNVDLLINVMNVLKKAPIKYDIPIYGKDTFHQMSVTSITELEKWLAHSSIHSSNNNWAFGCYLVQYILNCRGPNSAYEKLYGKKSHKYLNIPYEQQNMEQVNDTDKCENHIYLKTIADLNKDDDNILPCDAKTTNTESKNEPDFTLTTNPIESSEIHNKRGPCSVCLRKGLSTLLKCSGCQKYVHLICAKRVPLPNFENTHSKIICSNCS